MTDEAAPAPAEQSPAPEAVAPQAASPAPRNSVREALAAAAEKVGFDEPPEIKARQPEHDPDPNGKEAQARAADGKFAAREPSKEPVKDAAKPQAKPEQKQEEKPEAKGSEAPARFSAEAKAAWDKAPEQVRGEASRAVAELEKGIRDKDAILKPLKPYLDMAQARGKSLTEALDHYVGIDRAFAQGVVPGMTKVAESLGMTLPQLVAQIAPQQAAAQQPRAQTQQPSPEYAAMQREMAAMKQQLAAFHQQAQAQTRQSREQGVASEIAAFAQGKADFDFLAPQIAEKLTADPAMSLEAAYHAARGEMQKFFPPVSPAQIPAPPQTRPALSVTGAPASGSNPPRTQSRNAREAIERAAARIGF